MVQNFHISWFIRSINASTNRWQQVYMSCGFWKFKFDLLHKFSYPNSREVSLYMPNLVRGGDHPLNYQRKRAWRFPIVGMGCDKFNYIITSMPIVWFFQECRIVLDCTRVTHSQPSLKLLFSGINYNRNDGIRTSTELQLALK